jgi:hypothetical protein
MSFLKCFPWFSIVLLLASYATFGKFVISELHTWIAFAAAAVWGLVLAVMMINPLRGIRRMLTRWFKSDTVAFTSIVGAAAFMSILLNWFRLFLPITMIFAAESLARLDLQTAEFTQGQAFVILVITAWIGLGLGWAIAQMV